MDAYKSKVVTRIDLPDRERREQILRAAGYNLFEVAADDVYVDLLTDSGTGAMSDAQWAALLRGDEAYAGSSSFADLEAAVDDVMGLSRIVPVHQGRGGENVLYGALLSDGDYVPNNTHFDTTRAHVVNQGATPVDCPVPGAADPDGDDPFEGNLDVDAVRELAEEVGADRVPAVVLTITNNSMAGQPVSVANTRRARAVADDLDAALVIDACRFAENAYFVRECEAGYADASIREIAREQLSYADAVVMSGKKDGLVNVGGFVAVAEEPLSARAGGDGGPAAGSGVTADGSDRSPAMDGDDLDELFAACKQRAIMYEGFPTYGGMAGRDLAAMAVGLREAVELPYVRSRVEQVRDLGDRLRDAGVPLYEPVGGHAVYLDAAEAVPSVPPERFPGQSLVVELYREGAVRGVELGSFAFPDAGGDGGADGAATGGDDPAPDVGTDFERPEFVRLAVPRRMYHDEHLDHVAATAGAVVDRADDLPGYRIVEAPPVAELRHFSARLEPVED